MKANTSWPNLRCLWEPPGPLAPCASSQLKREATRPLLLLLQSHVMRSIYWAYVHWLFGRAAVAFAWVNIFLGIGRYRTWFGLGSWADAAFGFYIAGIALVRKTLPNLP